MSATTYPCNACGQSVGDPDGRWWPIGTTGDWLCARCWHDRQYGPRDGVSALQRLASEGIDAPPEIDARYAGRVLNLAELLAEDDDEQEWVIDRFAARGALTVLSGYQGVGKSLLTSVLAAAAQTGGGTVAGIEVADVPAVVVDAEQGRRVIRKRLKAAGTTPLLGYVMAAGLNVRAGVDQAFLIDMARTHGAGLLIADSLLRMSGGADENDSEMRHVMEAWTTVAQEADVAVVVLAHRGKDPKVLYRGHTTIGDVADGVFALERVEGDPDHRTRRRLRCGKLRLDEEPADRWLRITGSPLGVAAAAPFGDAPVRDELQDAILGYVVKHWPITQADALRGVGRQKDDKTGRNAIQALLDAGLLIRGDDGLRPGPGARP